MFLSLSWRSIQNGLLEQSRASSTGKYDINLSFYPQKKLPHITLNYGIYTKESGEKLSFDSGDENVDDEVIDTRLHTQTSSIYTVSNNVGALQTNKKSTFEHWPAEPVRSWYCSSNSKKWGLARVPGIT